MKSASAIVQTFKDPLVLNGRQTPLRLGDAVSVYDGGRTYRGDLVDVSEWSLRILGAEGGVVERKKVVSGMLLKERTLRERISAVLAERTAYWLRLIVKRDECERERTSLVERWDAQDEVLALAHVVRELDANSIGSRT